MTPSHALQETEFILGDLADLFSGKNSAYEDSVGDLEAWMNDGCYLVSTDTGKYLTNDFCPKGFMGELTRKFIASQMVARRC